MLRLGCHFATLNLAAIKPERKETSICQFKRNPEDKVFKKANINNFDYLCVIKWPNIPGPTSLIFWVTLCRNFEYILLHSASYDKKNYRRNQVGIGPVAAAAGIFLPQGHFTLVAPCLQAHSHLLTLCHRCSEDSRSLQGIPAGHQPDTSLSPMGYQRL